MAATLAGQVRVGPDQDGKGGWGTCWLVVASLSAAMHGGGFSGGSVGRVREAAQGREAEKR